MRFSFVALSVAFLTVVSAVAIPRGYGDSDVMLQRRTSRFFQHGSDSSSSSSSDHNTHTGSTHSGSPPQGGLSPPHSVGHPPSFSSGSSGHGPKPPRITFTDSARAQLDGLGLHGKDRKMVKKEHVRQIKQEMKTNGATHAQIHYLAHAQGSHDPNIHITAQFQKQHSNSAHLEPIKSTWHSSATGDDEKTMNHHVYVDQVKKDQLLRQQFPSYAKAVFKKQKTIAANEGTTIKKPTY